ncbi:MAG TPA: cytochrome P450 [Ktedonosporobacter sp.]|nr:cytochrome P450 [Ktedonosporobacter sp.]
MLTHTPVFYNEEMDAWNVFRYADVRRVLLDNEDFSSQVPFNGAPLPLDTSLIALDPPRHDHLRKLVSGLFPPSISNRHEQRIATLVNELLDRVIGQGKLDVIDDLAKPLPIMVMSELLGIPPADRAHIARWSAQLSCAAEPDGSNPQAEMSACFTDLFNQRRLLLQDPAQYDLLITQARQEGRRGPHNDLISKLLQADHIEDQPLSITEMLGFCILLLTAGTITVTHLIGNAFLCFSERYTTLRTLSAHPDLIPDAIEEVLRYRSPVQSMFRVAVKDTEIDGHKIEKHQFIVAYIGAANRDPAVFPDPDTFIIGRKGRRHIAFGYGPHYCLGATLAREQARIALEIMLARLPNIKYIPGSSPQPLNPASFLHGVEHLPISFGR